MTYSTYYLLSNDNIKQNHYVSVQIYIIENNIYTQSILLLLNI